MAGPPLVYLARSAHPALQREPAHPPAQHVRALTLVQLIVVVCVVDDFCAVRDCEEVAHVLPPEVAPGRVGKNCVSERLLLFRR
eukprot:5359911-Prymnesium_polylepis.5